MEFGIPHDKTYEQDMHRKILAMPYEQQDKAIAQWSMKYLNDYGSKPLPTPPTEDVKKYLMDTPQNKRALNSHPEHKFWRDPRHKEYFDTVEKIRTTNQRNLDWLNWLKKELPEQEDEINKVIYTHKDIELMPQKQFEQPDWRESND